MCVWGKLGHENHVIMVTSSFWRRFVHTTRKSQRFQFPPVWTSVFMRHYSVGCVFIFLRHSVDIAKMNKESNEALTECGWFLAGPQWYFLPSEFIYHYQRFMAVLFLMTTKYLFMSFKRSLKFILSNYSFNVSQSFGATLFTIQRNAVQYNIGLMWI